MNIPRHGDNNMMCAILLVAVEKILNPEVTEEQLLSIARSILGEDELDEAADLPFDAIKQADAPYPMQAARREQFAASIRATNEADERLQRIRRKNDPDTFLEKHTCPSREEDERRSRPLPY